MFFNKRVICFEILELGSVNVLHFNYLVSTFTVKHAGTHTFKHAGTRTLEHASTCACAGVRLFVHVQVSMLLSVQAALAIATRTPRRSWAVGGMGSGDDLTQKAPTW